MAFWLAETEPGLSALGCNGVACLVILCSSASDRSPNGRRLCMMDTKRILMAIPKKERRLKGEGQTSGRGKQLPGRTLGEGVTRQYMCRVKKKRRSEIETSEEKWSERRSSQI